MNIRNRITETRIVTPDEVAPNPRNWRAHPQSQRDALRGALSEIGIVAPVIAYYSERAGGKLMLIDGHERMTVGVPFPCVILDLNDSEADYALATFDPLTALAEKDARALDELLRDVTSGSEAIQQMLADLAVPLEPAPIDLLTDPDAVPDEAPTMCKRGDLWILGEHRLLCGDSTSAEDVQRVMMGDRADLVLTDPPYGVKRDKGIDVPRSFGGKTGKIIQARTYSDDWDSERPTLETFDLLCEQAENAIIFGGNFFADLLPQSTHWIVWDKLNTMPTFGDCELAWTTFDRTSVKKITHQYNGLIGKEKERFHPTQKPVALMEQILEQYSEHGQIILDPFGGSGTTLIACERQRRQCRMIELSEHYCDVIIRRWEDATGKKAVKQ